jgi:hypothetical protein
MEMDMDNKVIIIAMLDWNITENGNGSGITGTHNNSLNDGYCTDGAVNYYKYNGSFEVGFGSGCGHGFSDGSGIGYGISDGFGFGDGIGHEY